ncbi:MAG: hypothetical protein EXQ87_06605 [Alphaproteobacteria bacterium]|nr:hypothetical protein [Alphaproteobacteria bacterium]
MRQAARAMVKWRCRAWLFLILALAGCGTGPLPLNESLEGFLSVRQPAGAGPYPVALLVPGCGGLALAGSNSHYQEVAGWLVEAGYLALILDYVGAHGLDSACGGEMPLATLGHYVRIAIADAARLKDGDPARLHLIGWAWGGAGVLKATALDGAKPQVRSQVVYYPACRALSEWRSSVPTLVLVGEADRVTPSADCLALIDRGASPVLVARYRDAHHGFDVRALAPAIGRPGELFGPDLHYAYNEATRDAAWQDLTMFLATR